MKVLIVDDEAMIRDVIREYVEFEGGEVDEAQDGMEAVKKCRESEYDVILMDVMMPKIDGFSAVREIRKFSSTPVIMLSARGEEYDKLFGFELGSDDYVTKPFSPKELLARIHAVVRRGKAVASGEVYEFGGLKVDVTGHLVTIDGKRVELTPKEYDLLFYFAQNAGVALTRERLLNKVWGYDYYGDDRTVDTHVKMLRGNLGEYRKHIVTLRGYGYKFEV